MDAEQQQSAMAALQANMQQHLLTMQEQHRQEVAELRGLVAAGGGAARAPFVPQPVRLAPAPRYNGSTPNLDTWLSVIKQHCVYYQQDTDEQRRRFAFGNLEGPALVWFASLDDAHVPRTWDAFEAMLRAQYQPISTADVARDKLDRLTMGKKSVNAYVAAFRQLAVPLVGTDSATMMHYFRKGLSLHLQDIVYAHHPTELEAMITLAVRIGAGPTAQAAAAGSAMDLSAIDGDGDGFDDDVDPDAPITGRGLVQLLNAMHMHGSKRVQGKPDGKPRERAGGRWPSGIPRIDGFSEEKTRQYMENKQCFGCAATDHTSRNCPKKHYHPTTGAVSWAK